MVEHHFAAPPDVRAAVEVIYTHAWDPIPTSPDLEHEGVLRTQVLVESKVPAELGTDEFKVLGGQFIQQIFISSGGARYLPPIAAETALVEEFPENDSADAPSKLLSALRLPHRRGLARAEIENALMHFGANLLEEQLGLDPIEFRLVCIPYDLYMRFGRERGWGQWHRWTHFGGYWVVSGNRLRALVGGDGRFGDSADWRISSASAGPMLGTMFMPDSPSCDALVWWRGGGERYLSEFVLINWPSCRGDDEEPELGSSSMS